MSDVVLGRRYALESVLAQGGMATVWLARDQVLARPVAVKILHDHLAADAAFVERFEREALAAARLTHPNIVAIYDSGAEDGAQPKHYIVMEYCSGGTLANLTKSRSGLSPERVASMGSEICIALDFAHTAGVIHRDLKPANVLIAEDDLLKVGDFGIAKAAFASGDITTTGMILGTVAYVSPEQAQGIEPDARSDLYSLGILLYELLVGRPPFLADSAVATAMQHVQERPPAPRSMRAGIPRALDSVVLKALEKDPAKRWQDAAEMGAALRQAVGMRAGSPVRAATPTRSTKVGRPDETTQSTGRDARWTVGIVVLVIVAVALALSLVREQGDRPRADGDPGSSRITVVEVNSFDPQGDDGTEHEELVGNVSDGNPATTWITSQYEASLEDVGKEGVGLLFDLGRPRELSGVEIISPTPGYDLELLAAEELGADVDDYTGVATVTDAAERETIEVSAESARYWVLWCVELPPELQLSIAEVRFLAS
ncbi:MAG TPA: protein kinase [Actinomycetota bacterium]|nr:protein kinase [Actinomycetota bacterium]